MIRSMLRSTGPMLLVCLLLLSACEEDVVPVLGTDQAYTLYGFFNPMSDTQSVRVFPVEGQLEQTRPEPIDAQVVSTDVQSGEQLVWRDSVVQYGSGNYGHVFLHPTRVDFERTYRLEVTRSDGVVTEVETMVPPLSEAEISEASSVLGSLLVFVLWKKAPRLLNIVVRYFSNAGVEVVEYERQYETQADGQLVTLQFRRDTSPIFLRADEANITQVRLHKVEMEVTVANEEWMPPGDIFDPELLVEPGTFSNVENGFGFYGAGYPITVCWLPSDELQLARGFTVDSLTVNKCPEENDGISKKIIERAEPNE